MKLSEITDVELLRTMIKQLYDILENIDYAQEHLIHPREIFVTVEQLQKQRYTILESDGLDLYQAGTVPDRLIESCTPAKD